MIDQPLSGDPFDKSLEGRSKLIVDPGPKTVTLGSDPVRLDAVFQGSRASPKDGVKVTLGELRTDDHGRLVFLGGTGLARSVQKTNELYQPEIISEFDSVDWYDNACDGWVSVSVSHPARPHLTTLYVTVFGLLAEYDGLTFGGGTASPTRLPS